MVAGVNSLTSKVFSKASSSVKGKNLTAMATGLATAVAAVVANKAKKNEDAMPYPPYLGRDLVNRPNIQNLPVQNPSVVNSNTPQTSFDLDDRNFKFDKYREHRPSLENLEAKNEYTNKSSREQMRLHS